MTLALTDCAAPGTHRKSTNAIIVNVAVTGATAADNSRRQPGASPPGKGGGGKPAGKGGGGKPAKAGGKGSKGDKRNMPWNKW